jgi:hypothetical protein
MTRERFFARATEYRPEIQKHPGGMAGRYKNVKGGAREDLAHR